MPTCPSDRAGGAPPTFGQLLARGADWLARKGWPADEARTVAETLVSEAMGLRGRAGLALRAGETPGAAQVEALRGWFGRVGRGEPVQYVLGRWPFFSVELRVSPAALIPRPETEGLVERILAHPVWACAQRAADIGTGTGAIAIALAAEARRQGRPLCLAAVDVSPEALALARANVADNRLGDRVDCVEGTGAAGLPPGSCDFIVSNPPYIASAEVDALPLLIRAHEPRLALDGGPDGLGVIAQIVLDATQALRPGGWLFFEIGEDQGLSVRRLMERAGFAEVAVAPDLAGHDRYAEGRLP